MRKTILLSLLCSVLFLPLFAQSSSDTCPQAEVLSLSNPGLCPLAAEVSDTFRLNFGGATPTQPFPALAGCSAEGGLPDVWVQFTPSGNQIELELRNTIQSELVLFAGLDCGNKYAIACAAGGDSLSLQANVDPNLNYFLLIAGSATDGDAFDLLVRSSSDCSPCRSSRQGFFVASPAPENGIYQGGQEVQMCFTVSRWGGNSAGELLHAVELDFGAAWDPASFVPQPPASCSPEGSWGWFESWENGSGEFGPGFAFDSGNDGSPGNNTGLSGQGCANIGFGAPPVQFCWTMRVQDCPENNFGLFDELQVSARMLGDGLSGSRNQTACSDPETFDFLAAVECRDPLQPVIIAEDASCGEACDGSIYMEGGGQGPWDYIVTDSSGALVFLSTGRPVPETAENLCPGVYEVVIVDISSGGTRTQQLTIGSGAPVTASASYVLPCFVGEPIQLFGSASPAGEEVTYAWEGPNGFASTNQNPMALYPGAYTLVVTVDGCSSAPFVLEVPPVDEAVASIEADTIIACPGDSVTLTATGNASSFIWFEMGGNASVGSGQTITVLPSETTVYRVNGVNDQGCSGFDEVVVLLPFEPQLERSANGVICAGQSVTLTASGGTAYSWSIGSDAPIITIAPMATSAYTVTITNNDGCEAVFTELVQVSSGAGLFVSPDTEICPGDTISLAANGGVSQVWSTGETTSVISISPDTTTEYSVVQTDQYGCEHGSTVLVSVLEVPDISISPMDTAVCRGDSVLLTAVLRDSVIWDTVLAPQQSISYPIPLSFDCLESPVFEITVIDPPAAAIQAPNSTCGMDSVLLVAQGAGTYLWSTGATTDSLYVYPDSASTYSLTVTNDAGCSDTDSVTILQASAPASPVVSCEAGFEQLAFSWEVDSSLTYSLVPVEGPIGQPVGNNTYVVSGLNPGDSVTVEVVATNAAGCSNSTFSTCVVRSCSDLELLTFVPETICGLDGLLALVADVSNGTDEGSGSWSGPGVDASASTFDPQLTGPGQFELAYLYQDGPCSVSDTVLLQVDAGFSAAQVSCESANGSILFSWAPASQDTAYEVIVLSGQAGAFSDSTSYLVDSLQAGDTVAVAITAFGTGACGAVTVEASCIAESFECPELQVAADTFICEGATAQLWADSLEWDTYSWSPAVELSCLDCPAPTASPLGTTTYTVVAANAAGCTDTAQVTVYVEDFPASYIPDTTIIFCPGEPFELCMPDGDIHYWIGPGAALYTDQCLSLESPGTANNGRYYAFMRKGGCRFIKQFFMMAAPEIEVDEITDIQTVCPGDTFTLKVVSDEAVSYSWNLEEYLFCPDCPETQGQVPQTATFTVTMEDSYGCKATADATVFVEDCGNMPLLQNGTANVLSDLEVFPNPSSGQFKLRIAATGLKTAELWNATGQRVLHQQFDGGSLSVDGSQLPAGHYILRLLTEDGVTSKLLQIIK